mmetsp:Transcript_5559/g.14977  ORF Transcript_5559/g.14977 Transcript_5559/m.14977 type:complete len:238 (-) Transcript_5559:1121-1834(-)
MHDVPPSAGQPRALQLLTHDVLLAGSNHCCFATQARNASMRAGKLVYCTPSQTSPSSSASSCSCSPTSGPCMRPVNTMRMGMNSLLPLRFWALPTVFSHALKPSCPVLMAAFSSPLSCAASTASTISFMLSSKNGCASGLARVCSRGYSSSVHSSLGASDSTSRSRAAILTAISMKGVPFLPTVLLASRLSSTKDFSCSSGSILMCCPFIHDNLVLSNTAALLVMRSRLNFEAISSG